MPYNTRRKSISLTSLGVNVPHSRQRSNSKPVSSPEPVQDQSPPSKRVKREHSTPSPIPSPRRTPSADLSACKPHPISQPRTIAHTPPPSPGDVVVAHRTIDLDGINDDVVISCIEQLEKTGNRPHLLKELATVLLTTNRNIANSANPAALLSSRLTQYMKRPWTALSPCPIAKELVPVHPRKVFFFLTSRPRGELPANSDDIMTPAIQDIKRLTPSISDPSIEDEETMERNERMRFSPSPEIELFSPELHTTIPTTVMPATPGSSYSGRSLHEEPIEPPRRQRSANRAPSPTLEADERGFTETASAVRANRLLQQTSDLQINVQQPSDEPKLQAEHEVATSLFGRMSGALSTSVNESKHIMMSSPMMIPKHNLAVQILDIDMEMDEPAWNIKSPEATSFDELDQMFDDL